jgi:hypothetical protein
MNYHYLAVSFAILVLVYHQLTTWLPLYPWNDISKYTIKELLLEGGTNCLLMGIGLLCIVIGNHGFYHYYPLFYYPFLLTGEIFQWWLPYFSKKFARSQVNFEYETRFSHTTKIIPHKEGRRTPDANHILLHLITVITVIFIFVDRW